MGTSSTAKRKTARLRAPGPVQGWPQRLCFWCAPALEGVDRTAIAQDLRSAAPSFPAPEWRGDLLQGAAPTMAKLAGARVRDPKVAHEFFAATTADVEIERAVDERPAMVGDRQLASRLYDAGLLAQAVLPALPAPERNPDVLPVWLTRRLVVTYSQQDYRYHARYAVFSYPVIFSLLGLVHAPAPSFEATLFARELGRRGMTADQVWAETDKQYPEERVDLLDHALVAHAVASCVLQAVARNATGEAFCGEPNCRLFNPHRRAQVRRSIGGQTLCPRHRQFFERGGNPG